MPRSPTNKRARPTGTSSETYSYPHKGETFRLRNLQQVLCPQRPACSSRETRPPWRRGATYHKKVPQTSSAKREQCCQSGPGGARGAPDTLHVLGSHGHVIAAESIPPLPVSSSRAKRDDGHARSSADATSERHASR